MTNKFKNTLERVYQSIRENNMPGSTTPVYPTTPGSPIAGAATQANANPGIKDTQKFIEELESKINSADPSTKTILQGILDALKKQENQPSTPTSPTNSFGTAPSV